MYTYIYIYIYILYIYIYICIFLRRETFVFECFNLFCMYLLRIQYLSILSCCINVLNFCVNYLCLFSWVFVLYIGHIDEIDYRILFHVVNFILSLPHHHHHHHYHSRHLWPGRRISRSLIEVEYSLAPYPRYKRIYIYTYIYIYIYMYIYVYT
jgi:hypothetical protein